MATPEDVVREHLVRWAEDLIDLSRRNRLLYFHHTKSTTFEFAQTALEVEAGLEGRRGWGFYLPPPPAEDPVTREIVPRATPDELVVALTPTRYRPQLERGLKTLKARAEAEFLDAGIWVLYVGLGRLDWVDVDEKPAQSPLLLVPAHLSQEGADKRWRLRLSDDGEPALNPALAVKLQTDFGIDIPSLDEMDTPDVEHALAAVQAAVVGTRWKVEPAVVMGTFTFQKEVIYRDLRDNATMIATHPIIRLMAEGPSSPLAADLQFEPESEDTLDERHPPESLACVLDADATQRQCVIAARAGRSFVMDGPPGTGKSQTIANVIAQLLKDGKTVLFVSEKAAALEVVQKRLAERQLDPFALSLHSQNATRKAVAQDLGRALDERPTARPRFDETKRARLVRERSRLTSYAVAVNEVRRPLGKALHDVAGRIAQLHDLPSVEVPEIPTASLSPGRFEELREAAEQLGRAWSPISRGDEFLWRDLKQGAAAAGREASLRRRVESLAASANALREVSASLADELRAMPPQGPLDTERLAELLDLIDDRHPVGERWLTTKEIDDVASAVARIVPALRKRALDEEWLANAAPEWRKVDLGADERLTAIESQLAGMTPRLGALDQRSAADLRKFADAVELGASVVARLGKSTAVLSSIFNVDKAPTIERARRLVSLAGLVGSSTPPEPTWLDPSVKPAIDEGWRLLSQLLRDYRRQREALQPMFKPSVLEMDVRSLRARFRDVHTGLHKLSGEYRADKKALAAVTVSGKVTDEVIARLDEVVNWQGAAEQLAQVEQRYGPALGSRYFPSRDGADLDQTSRALAVADEALLLAGEDVGAEALAGQLSLGAVPDARLSPAAKDASAALDQLNEAQFRSVAKVIERLSINKTTKWCQSAAASLRDLAGELESLQSLTGRSFRVGDARSLASKRFDVSQLDESIGAEIDARRAELGAFAENPSADELETAAGWVAAMRTYFGGALRPRFAKIVLATDLTPPTLRDPLAAYEKAADALFGEFSPIHGDGLRRECDASFESGAALLGAMLATVADVQEWDTYVAARSTLVQEGWEPTIRSCEEARVSAPQVAQIVERSILTRWVDEVVSGDPRLSPRRSVDRDELLAAFRELDTELVADAAAGVINACTALRPKSLAGQAGIINKQAQLKRKHLPVRRLLEQAGQAAQQLKPCFMMSPLSVSQFLPPGIHFDVVIFDEASQVREADAICSIFRGTQLIISGDPKQLPPTDFFARIVAGDGGTDDDGEVEFDEFESVLDRCKAQGFSRLPLNWHYRSRHEALIAFSNRSFYDGRLHTFPGATFEAPDLGVELYLVDGTYGRGSTKDNPIEAEAVVDRIVEHRRQHPRLTIGVVALSAVQQTCIEIAIERRAEREPELRELDTDNRLDGFFVKNLENVQGDERDLIILSIGYGPDEAGKLTMNFGPMNREGGWRRLNVAVTRARQRVEVVSSVSAGQIVSEKTSIRHLARYLDYAERGQAALAMDVDETEGLAESPFEDEVLRSITALGYEAVPQVGVAGYRLDIGIRHPILPGRYVLGVECDGFTYHSSKVARDRDRLRQSVLEGLGWHLHRIWSTAWFYDRAAEEARLREAIAGALGNDGSPVIRPASPGDVDVVVEDFDFDDFPEWAYVYDPPAAPVGPARGQDFCEPSSRSTLVRQIVEIVSSSGPIHEVVVLDVVRDSWGLGRTGSRMRDAFDAAVRSAVARGAIEVSGAFLEVPGQEVVVRVPESDGATARRVAHVPPAELDLAIVQLLCDAGPTELDRLRTAWARLFGWRRVGPDIEVAFDEAVDRLLDGGRIDGSSVLSLVGESR
jgi:hypothetical protein